MQFLQGSNILKIMRDENIVLKFHLNANKIILLLLKVQFCITL